MGRPIDDQLGKETDWTQNRYKNRKLKNYFKDHVAYEEWKKTFPNLVETLEEFPSLRPDASLLVTQMPKLHARVYSISSNPKDIESIFIKYLFKL